MNPERVPSQENPVTPEQIQHIADEIFGKDSEDAGVIGVILEEGEKDSRVLPQRIKEAREKIFDYLAQGRYEGAPSGEKLLRQFKQLGLSDNESKEKLLEIARMLSQEDEDKPTLH